MRNFLTARELRASVRKLDPRARRDRCPRGRHYIRPGAGKRAAGTADLLGLSGSGHADRGGEDDDLVPRRRRRRARHGHRARLAQRQPRRQAARALRRPGRELRPDKPFEANETVTVTTDRNVVGATNGDFKFNIGDETTRKARPVEFPNVGRGTVQEYATRPDLHAAVGDGHHRQARPRARARVPRPEGRPRPGRPDDHQRQRPARLVQADARARSRPTSASRPTTASRC